MPTELLWTRIVVAFIEQAGQVLITRRPRGVHQGGRWEFPGGKVDAGETLPAALAREMREELGVTVAVDGEIAATRYRYPERAVELHLLRCRILAGEPSPRAATELRWVPLPALRSSAFPPANPALLDAITPRVS